MPDPFALSMQKAQAMDDETQNLRVAFIFSLKVVDNERVPVDVAPKLHRARVRNSLRVIRGGKRCESRQ